MKSFDKRWEEVHQEKEWGKYPSEEIIRFVARNYYKRNRAEVKLLDAGCGGGATSWYVAREGFAAYGFDGSETAIKKAKKRLEEEGLEASFVVGDAAEMPYSDESFAGIIDSALICANSVSNIKKILKECYRVLEDGGKIFSTGLFEVGMSGYGTGEKIEENTYRQITEGSVANIGTVHFFTNDEIRELWEEAGFTNVKIGYSKRIDLGGEVTVSYFMAEGQKLKG